LWDISSHHFDNDLNGKENYENKLRIIDPKFKLGIPKYKSGILRAEIIQNGNKMLSWSKHSS
jgi:hypothetical protein